MRLAVCGLGMAMVLLAMPELRADDAAAAEALFQQGKQLAKDGKWAEACPKFKGSYKLEKGLGTLIALAHCYESINKVASSWSRWKAALEWAKRDGDPRVDYITQRIETLDPRLPYVRLVVSNPVVTLTVERDGSAVPAEAFGAKLPVDPGPLKVRVLRGKVLLEEKSAEAKEASVVEVPLDLAAIDKAHPPPKEAIPPPPPPPPPPYDPLQRNLGLIVGGVGAAAVLVAVGLEIGAVIKKGQADEPDACVNGFCAPQGLEAAETAATLAEAGQWVGIAGLVGFAVGATVFFTAPSDKSKEPPPPSAWIAPWSPPAGLGLQLGGTL